MSGKHILIVDEEEAILTIFKRSLAKVLSRCQIVTAADGFAALDVLLAQRFAVVVIDFNLAAMDGLELIEAIRYIQPEAKLVVLTAHHTDIVEAEVARVQAYCCLTKPVHMRRLRQVVRAALADGLDDPSRLQALSVDQYQQIGHLLETLRSEVGARCVFLTDVSGHLIACAGETDQLAVEIMASLLGGGMATVLEAGRMRNQNCDSINLVYQEGEQEDLYAINIGRQRLLIILVNRGLYSSRLGTVWYHAQQAALALRDQPAKTEPVNRTAVFNERLDQAFELRLDDLFK